MIAGWRKLEQYEHPQPLGYSYSYHIPAEERGTRHRYDGKCTHLGGWFVATETEFAHIILMETFCPLTPQPLAQGAPA